MMSEQSYHTASISRGRVCRRGAWQSKLNTNVEGSEGRQDQFTYHIHRRIIPRGKKIRAAAYLATLCLMVSFFAVDITLATGTYLHISSFRSQTSVRVLMNLFSY